MDGIGWINCPPGSAPDVILVEDDSQGGHGISDQDEKIGGLIYPRGLFSKEISVGVIDEEPRTLLKHRPNVFEKSTDTNDGILALLEPNIALAHQTIATNRNLKKVRIVENSFEFNSLETLHFFDELKASLDPFSIDTSRAWETISAEALGQTRSSREQSIDFINR